MITKNNNIGISENVTIADFGNGSIIVVDVMISKERLALVFANDTPKQIGTPHLDLKGKSIEDVNIDIILSFTKTESIDIVIEALQRMKTNMQSKPAILLETKFA